jgi:U3 small nucleolar ribonucleoprotein protein IMP3
MHAIDCSITQLANVIPIDVCVGPDVVNDPAYIVARNMEDFIKWSPNSAIRRQVRTYNDQQDDYQ